MFGLFGKNSKPKKDKYAEIAKDMEAVENIDRKDLISEVITHNNSTLTTNPATDNSNPNFSSVTSNSANSSNPIDSSNPKSLQDNGEDTDKDDSNKQKSSDKPLSYFEFKETRDKSSEIKIEKPKTSDIFIFTGAADCGKSMCVTSLGIMLKSLKKNVLICELSDTPTKLQTQLAIPTGFYDYKNMQVFTGTLAEFKENVDVSNYETILIKCSSKDLFDIQLQHVITKIFFFVSQKREQLEKLGESLMEFNTRDLEYSIIFGKFTSCKVTKELMQEVYCSEISKFISCELATFRLTEQDYAAGITASLEESLPLEHCSGEYVQTLFTVLNSMYEVSVKQFKKLI